MYGNDPVGADCARVAVAGLAERDRDAEIDELDLAVARQHHVARRQIAMDHALALAMRVVEPVEDARGDPRGDRAAAMRSSRRAMRSVSRYSVGPSMYSIAMK